MKLSRSLLWAIVIAIVQVMNGAGLIPAAAAEHAGIASAVAGAVVALALSVKTIIDLYRQAHSNPDGTPATQKYVPPV